MTCPPPSSYPDLAHRIAALERQLAGFREITGTDPSTGPFIVTVLSVEHDVTTLRYSIVFSSTPGDLYQVQTSTNATTWVSLGNVAAAASPAISTTWVSEPYPFDVVDYFRIRRYPKTLVPCTP
jgi:hypothetical protein